MKNLKFYFSILFLSLLTGSIFFACSSDDNQSQQATSSTKSSNLTNKSASITSGAITCYISGSTVTNQNTNDAYSSVSAGSTTTYQYNSTPSVSNVTWSIVPGTVIPSGSLTITASGSTASVTVASNFQSGSIQAVGTDATGQICGPVLPIIKSTGGGIACCVPELTARFICRGSGAGAIGGNVTVLSPAGCSIDWSTISSIEIQLSGNTHFTSGVLTSLSQGTLLPNDINFYLNNNKLLFPFHDPACEFEVECHMTFHYNNGCPSVETDIVTYGPLASSTSN